MKPEAIYKCIKDYSGVSKHGKPFRLREGTLYFKMTGDNQLVYLNEYENPHILLPWLQLEEFTALENSVLKKASSNL